MVATYKWSTEWRFCPKTVGTWLESFGSKDVT